jgi:hypothetical protein
MKNREREKAYEYIQSVLSDCPKASSEEAINIAKNFVNDIIYLTTNQKKVKFYEKVYDELDYYLT